MTRLNRTIAAACIVAATATGAAYADTAPDRQPAAMAAVEAQPAYQVVIAGLQADGYKILWVRRSFLGRYRIQASNAMHLREVVVSRTTGEILRDAILTVYAGTAPDGGQNANAPGTAPAEGGDSGTTGKVKNTVKKTAETVKDTVGGLGLGN